MASGKAWSIKSILERLMELSMVFIDVKVDREKLWPLVNPLVLGSASKLWGETASQPQRDFLRETLVDLLDDRGAPRRTKNGRVPRPKWQHRHLACDFLRQPPTRDPSE